MKKSFIGVFTIVLCFVFIFSSVPLAVALETEADEFSLEEITVTAEKRTENVQKTAIAITAISGENIIKNAQITLESVLRDVPALQIQRSAQGGQIYIRGVGANGDSNWVDPSIALTLDNVYSGRSESVFTAMYDIDRVEVLRGPQGTLYGRNATGGSINVVTKNPSFNKFETIGTIQVGNYNLWHFDGAVNVPVTEKLAFRIALLREHRDGYFSNGARESNPANVRGKILFEPTEDLSMMLTLDYSKNDVLDNTTVSWPHTSGPPPFQWDVKTDDPWYVDSWHPAEEREDTFKTASLKVDYNLNWATATFIPAYTQSDRYAKGGLLFGTFDGSSLTTVTFKEDQYTFEARLASPEESTLKWVLGSFLLSSKNQTTDDSTTVTDTYESYGNDHPATSFALFGQSTYPVTDQFRVTAGLRYTKDKKSNDYGIRSTAIPGYDTGLHTAETTYSETTFKAGVEYDPGPSSMLYAQISTGYKAGGFNTSAMPPKAYDPEKLVSYEVGSKSRFWNDRVQLNAEAYLYDYDDYQIQYPLYEALPIPAEYIPAGADTIQFAQYIANAGSAINYGADIELKYLITPNDQVDLTFAYQHARYGDLLLSFIPMPGSTLTADSTTGLATVDYTDTEVANSPTYSGTLGYQHSFVLSNGGVLAVGGRLKLSSGYWATTEKHLENAWQENYHRSDVNISYISPYEKLSVNAWVKNIENDYQKTTILPFWRMMITDPRTYGVTLTVRW